MISLNVFLNNINEIDLILSDFFILKHIRTIKTCNVCSLAKVIHHLWTWYWKAWRGYIEPGYNSTTNNNNNIAREKGVSFRSWFRLMFLSWLTCHLQPINNRGTKFLNSILKTMNRESSSKKKLVCISFVWTTFNFPIYRWQGGNQ